MLNPQHEEMFLRQKRWENIISNRRREEMDRSFICFLLSNVFPALVLLFLFVFLLSFFYYTVPLVLPLLLSFSVFAFLFLFLSSLSCLRSLPFVWLPRNEIQSNGLKEHLRKNIQRNMFGIRSHAEPKEEGREAKREYLSSACQRWNVIWESRKWNPTIVKMEATELTKTIEKWEPERERSWFVHEQDGDDHLQCCIKYRNPDICLFWTCINLHILDYGNDTSANGWIWRNCSSRLTFRNKHRSHKTRPR